MYIHIYIYILCIYIYIHINFIYMSCEVHVQTNLSNIIFFWETIKKVGISWDVKPGDDGSTVYTEKQPTT